MGRFRVCNLSDLTAEKGLECVAGDRIVAVFRVGDDVFAMDGICAHAGGPLGKGCLAGETVTCPWHGWQYNITTGQHLLTPRIKQARYAANVVEGEVFVDVPE
jgi:nitrite reductase (NADH) small subunit